MNCAWKELLTILPLRIRTDVDRLGRNSAQEIRLREGAPPELLIQSESVYLPGSVTREELEFAVNTASRYSPWSASTISKGYITAAGGHRIGLCGDAVIQGTNMTGIRRIRSLCIRIARDFQGIGAPLRCVKGSVLILGAPGWGKTTLLRDLVRQASEHKSISVVDERGELFPPGFQTGKHIDILTGCPKPIGIEMLLRTMGPGCIAVDEITAAEDTQAILEASYCGVDLLATVHAASTRDLKQKPLYRSLVENNVFQTYVIMSPDRSWRMERI